jgi:two-component system, sensor histidine kinase and response regulator
VILAITGSKAIELSQHEAFDMILMDVQMPEMDGLEATAVIRESEKASAKHVPIIALTAHAMTGDREMCLTAGMDGYVAKPINAEDLNNEIQRLWLEMQGGPHAIVYPLKT